MQRSKFNTKDVWDNCYKNPTEMFTVQTMATDYRNKSKRAQLSIKYQKIQVNRELSTFASLLM